MHINLTVRFFQYEIQCFLSKTKACLKKISSITDLSSFIVYVLLTDNFFPSSFHCALWPVCVILFHKQSFFIITYRPSSRFTVKNHLPPRFWPNKWMCYNMSIVWYRRYLYPLNCTVFSFSFNSFLSFTYIYSFNCLPFAILMS